MYLSSNMLTTHNFMLPSQLLQSIDQSAINILESCLLSLHAWYLHNGIAVNPDKSEAIMFGTSHAVAHALPATQSINCCWQHHPILQPDQAPWCNF